MAKSPNYIDLIQASSDAINAKEVDETIIETVKYGGFTSRGVSDRILLPNEIDNTSAATISVTNTDHTRFTFLEQADFVSVGSYNGAASNGSFNVRLYDSSNVLKTQVTGITDNGGGAQEATLIGQAQVGDYITFDCNLDPTNNIGTNFSVTATKVNKVSIDSL